MSKGLGVWTTTLLLDTFHTMLEVLLELRVPFDRPKFLAALFREPENLMCSCFKTYSSLYTFFCGKIFPLLILAWISS